jgi:dihydroxyacetone kinase-like protein
MVNRDQIVEWLRRSAQVLVENKTYLTDLDAAIGDADHGINMDRGFQKVLAQLPTVEKNDIGNILKTTGMALISSVGGAGGPLYGTFFMRAGMVTDGKQELTDDDLVKMFESAVEGVIQRGKANPGDKTMIDALVPAVDVLRSEVAGGGLTTAEAMRRAVAAAQEGMLGTIPLVARKGRASYLGERSAGHQDPGATSSYLILNTLLEVISSSEI